MGSSQDDQSVLLIEVFHSEIGNRSSAEIAIKFLHFSLQVICELLRRQEDFVFWWVINYNSFANLIIIHFSSCESWKQSPLVAARVSRVLEERSAKILWWFRRCFDFQFRSEILQWETQTGHPESSPWTSQIYIINSTSADKSEISYWSFQMNLIPKHFILGRQGARQLPNHLHWSYDSSVQEVYRETPKRFY